MKHMLKAVGLGLGVMLLGILAVMAQVGPAYAIPYLEVDLTNWNVDDLQSTGDKVHVTAENTNGNTTLTFTFVYGTQPPTIQDSPQKGLDELGWNSTALVLSAPAGWFLANQCNLDGFGCFNPDYAYPVVVVNGNTGAGSGPISFLLAGNNLTFGDSTGNNGGHQFAAHVQFGNECSGFVSDGDHVFSDPPTSGGTGCSAQVPEPASLLLLGFGLAGLGLWGRKRFRGIKD